MSLMRSALEKNLDDLGRRAKAQLKCKTLNARLSKRACVKRQYFAQRWTREGRQKAWNPWTYSECKDCEKGRKVAGKLGLILFTSKKKRAKCQVKSCNKEIFSGNLCADHYLNYIKI